MDILHPPSAVIENVSPLIECGRYPVKRAVGEDLVVEADIFKDGHDLISAVLKWRPAGAPQWHETPMTPIPNGNDRWRGVASFFENTMYEYTVEAWTDVFGSWQHEFRKKFQGGIQDLTSETLEGAALVEAAAKRAGLKSADGKRLLDIAQKIRGAEPAAVDQIAHWTELEALMAHHAERVNATEYAVAEGPIALPESSSHQCKPARGTESQKPKRRRPVSPRTFIHRSGSIVREENLLPGTSSSRGPPRDLRIAARRSGVALAVSMTRRRWVLMSSIFHRFTPSA